MILVSDEKKLYIGGIVKRNDSDLGINIAFTL